MSKEFYDKYGKLVGCFSCNCIEPCSKSDSPICSEGYVFFAKDKITDLEAKLAEKEKKYQDAEKCAIEYQNQNTLLEQEIEHLRSCLAFATEQMKKDKISFALEQLEKVKDFCDGMKWTMVYLTKENTQTIQTVLDEIDNQIKAIKEVK